MRAIYCRKQHLKHRTTSTTTTTTTITTATTNINNPFVNSHIKLITNQATGKSTHQHMYDMIPQGPPDPPTPLVRRERPKHFGNPQKNPAKETTAECKWFSVGSPKITRLNRLMRQRERQEKAGKYGWQPEKQQYIKNTRGTLFFV